MLAAVADDGVNGEPTVSNLFSILCRLARMSTRVLSFLEILVRKCHGFGDHNVT